MKVVFFRHSLLNRGGDKMVLAHAGNLAACGHQVVIVSNVVETVLDIPTGVSIEMLSGRGKFGTIIYALSHRIEAEVIIADIIAMSLLLSFWNSGKVVYFAQDYDESYYTNLFMKGLMRLFYFVGLRLFRIPTIAVSHPLAELLRKRFSSDAAVAENGVDAKVFYPDTDPELISLKGNRKAVLLLSRSDRRKGFDLAIEVVSRLKEELGDDFEVWIVGEKTQKVFHNVIHRNFGYVDEDEIRKIMSSADLFLYPSRHEGLPLMPLEAFACRCPVVTTVAVPYAENLVNAMVSKLEDVGSLTGQACRLLTDVKLKDKITNNAFDYASGHSLQHSIKAFSNILLNLPN